MPRGAADAAGSAPRSPARAAAAGLGRLLAAASAAGLRRIALPVLRAVLRGAARRPGPAALTAAGLMLWLRPEGGTGATGRARQVGAAVAEARPADGRVPPAPVPPAPRAGRAEPCPMAGGADARRDLLALLALAGAMLALASPQARR